jgi:hypothetical protein
MMQEIADRRGLTMKYPLDKRCLGGRLGVTTLPPDDKFSGPDDLSGDIEPRRSGARSQSAPQLPVASAIAVLNHGITNSGIP